MEILELISALIHESQNRKIYALFYENLFYKNRLTLNKSQSLKHAKNMHAEAGDRWKTFVLHSVFSVDDFTITCCLTVK